MKIAMLAPIAWRTPPRHYGPWENVVSLLTEGLVRRGIDVTLFATQDSQTQGKLIGVCPRGYEEDKSLLPKVWECLHISEVFERGEEFDLIHNHFDFLPLTYIGMTTTPVITTIHGFSSPKILPVYKKYNKKTFYVAISEADRHPELDYIATIHHGIDLRQFTFRPDPGDYLLFFGRIHHDKGTQECIEIARQAKMKLIIAGIIQDEDYFNQKVKPHLDNEQIIYVGSADPERRNQLLGEAYALLHPINFNEPFGLSVVEAMACGTPVLAVNRGSMPEIILHGTTGFLANKAMEIVDFLPKVKELDRSRCRKWVEERFSVDRMVSDYLQVYENVLALTRREKTFFFQQKKLTNQPIVKRYEKNPILTKYDVPYPVETVHNAGVVKYEGKYIMLFRSHLRNGRSIIGLAESEDGFNFRVQKEPFLTPATIEPFATYEEYGVEDPRICFLDNAYWITYSTYSRHGVRIGLARTEDFKTIQRISLITPADYRNVVLFPEKFNGRYARLDRPHSEISPWSIWISYSPDLIHWGDSKLIIKPMNYHWDELKIGPGATPIKTKHGWLNIFHGVFKTMDGAIYRLGVALHDLLDPAKVISVADEWILQPEDPWEITGYVHNVVFCCGAILEEDGTIKIYWGGADSVMCAGTALIDDLVNLCLSRPRPAI